MTAMSNEALRQFAQEAADALDAPFNVHAIDDDGREVAHERAVPQRTREQIEAEKAAKPRPDLLPVRGVLAICREAPAGHMLFSLLAAQGSDEKIEHLAAAGRAIASELGGTAAALLKAGEVMGYGFRKHGRCTWRVAGTEQADPQTHYASAVRHVLERIADADASEEGSGKPVLYHALAQIIIAIDLLENPPKIEGENDGAGML